jgi:hypothetical protein
MLRTAALLLTLVLSGVTEAAMADAKTDVEALMNAALPFAEQMLRKNGEFYPYACVLNPDGTISMVAGYDGRERPPSQEIIDLLRSGFRADAKAHKIRATAIVYDMRIATPATGVKTDAIAVALDHSDQYSVTVIFPYTLNKSQLDLGDPFAQKGASDIFPAETSN